MGLLIDAGISTPSSIVEADADAGDARPAVILLAEGRLADLVDRDDWPAIPRRRPTVATWH